MNLAVLIAPYATATPEEVVALRKVQAALARQGIVAIWLPDTTEHCMDDTVPDQREVGLRGSEALVELVARAGGDAYVIGERKTSGMVRDLAAWARSTPRTAILHRIR